MQWRRSEHKSKKKRNDCDVQLSIFQYYHNYYCISNWCARSLARKYFSASTCLTYSKEKRKFQNSLIFIAIAHLLSSMRTSVYTRALTLARCLLPLTKLYLCCCSRMFFARFVALSLSNFAFAAYFLCHFFLVSSFLIVLSTFRLRSACELEHVCLFICVQIVYLCKMEEERE